MPNTSIQQLSWVIGLTTKIFGLSPPPVDSNKLCHQGFAKEVSRYFFIAGLPVTRSVKSLCKSGNLLCGAVSIGKSSLATFLCLALPVQIEHLTASIPAEHSQNICHRLLLLEIYRSRASCATQRASVLVKNPFWMPVTALLSIYLCTRYSHFLDLVFTSMAFTHFLAELQISLAGSDIAAHAAICQLDSNPTEEGMC